MSTLVETPPPAKTLLTAEEYAVHDDGGRRTELVNGEVVVMPPPSFQHGVVCSRIDRRLGNYVEDRALGWVLSNDSGVVTRRGPDTVRGADWMYYSYQRVPPEAPPAGYAAVAPDLVFEVKSPSDRTRATVAKAKEYLSAGVGVVCLVDPESCTVEVHTKDRPPRRLGREDTLTLPEVFPDFSVPVRALVG